MTLTTLTALLLAYLLGSIPFGLLLTHAAGLGDVRKLGSGNIGATNVLRTGKKGLAALTLFLDGFKGVVAVLATVHFYPDLAALAGLAALLGHLFPLWLKFKGGKGVATAAGVLGALVWQVGVISILVWVAVAFLSRRSSVAALVAAALTPVEMFLFGHNDLVWLTVVIVILIFWKHTANIKRLRNGTEPRIGQ